MWTLEVSLRSELYSSKLIRLLLSYSMIKLDLMTQQDGKNSGGELQRTVASHR